MNQEVAQARAQTPAPERTGTESTRPRPVFRPLTDIHESGDSITMVMEMPGVAADDVDITLEKRVLTVRGTSRLKRPENYRPVYTEYGEGDYERSFTLSQDIDVEGIEASCRNGLLTLKLPKAQQSQPRQIRVTSG